MSPRVLSSEAREPERRARRVPGADVFVREGVLHTATDHADAGLSECQEVMGLLVGRVYEDASGMYAEVTGIVTGDLEAGSAEVRFDKGSFEALADSIDSMDDGDSIVGWYHSHLGVGCGLSEVDVRTQSSLFGEFGYAMVVDPVRGELSVHMSADGGIRQATMVVLD